MEHFFSGFGFRKSEFVFCEMIESEGVMRQTLKKTVMCINVSGISSKAFKNFLRNMCDEPVVDPETGRVLNGYKRIPGLWPAILASKITSVPNRQVFFFPIPEPEPESEQNTRKRRGRRRQKNKTFLSARKNVKSINPCQ